MEQLETAVSLRLGLGELACAAHLSANDAIASAQAELVERLTLADWWAYRRGGIDPRAEMAGTLTAEHALADGFKLAIGEIPSLVDGYSVCVSILNAKRYPYVVLGAACAPNLEDAARHSYHESLLSWGASVWLREHHYGYPLWDYGELHLRTRIAPAPKAPRLWDSAEALMAHTRASIVVEQLGQAVVALIHSPLAPRYSTATLAQLVADEGDVLVVHSEANH